MAAGRRPGPMGLDLAIRNIDDGTMCLAPSPLPGPVGAGANIAVPETSLGSHEYASLIFTRAIFLSPAAIDRQTGHKLGYTLKNVIPNLLLRLASVDPGASSTASGFAMVGQLRAESRSGTRLADGRDVFAWLAVPLRWESHGDFSEMSKAILAGRQLASNIANLAGTERSRVIDLAASHFANAIGIFARAMLVSIRASLDRDVSPAAQHIRATQVVGALGRSRLKGDFAAWVEHNWKILVKDPMLGVSEMKSSSIQQGQIRRNPDQDRSSPAHSPLPPSLPISKGDRIPPVLTEGKTEDIAPKTHSTICRGNVLYRQEESMSCVLASSRMIIQQMTGTDPGEATLRGEASKAGWYDPINGSDPWQIPSLLKAHGIPGGEAKNNMSLDDIEAATATGKPVMVGLKNPGHRILVDGVRTNADGSKTILVRDPGYTGAAGCRDVTVDEFLNRYNTKAPVIRFK